MAYGDETERILGQLRSYFTSLSDDHTRTMAAAWARAWDDVAPDLTQALAELAAAADDGNLTRAQIIRSRRLANALTLIEARLSGLFDQSARHVIDQLGDVVDNAGRTTDRLISSQLPYGETVDGWSRVDAGQVDAIVARTAEQITKRSFPLSDEATAAMRRELVRGMLVGANPLESARRMVSRVEGRFNGGLSRAMTIARTEMLDAHRRAAQITETENVDVLAGWTWVASLSERTCPSCWSKHGQEFPLDVPGPEDHQNGRCARVPRTKTWRELGFDLDEPAPLLPDAETRFAALPEPTQVEILGPARYAAWRAGHYPMSAWTERRTSDGWRDSWGVSKAPRQYRGARRPTTDTLRGWRFGRGAKVLGGTPKSTLRAIADVHEVPQLLRPVTVLPLTQATMKARPGLQGEFQPSTLQLRLNQNGLAKGLTTAHEFAHYLDFQDFGAGAGMASATSNAPEWKALRAAWDQTPEVRALRAITRSPDQGQKMHASYLVSDAELFARAYAQWIALRTGRRSLQRELTVMRKLPGIDGLRQWEDRSFGAIADALDDLFESRLRS